MYLSVGSPESVGPEKVRRIAFFAPEWVGAFSMIFTGLFSASPGAQLQEITSSLFRSNGSNTIAIVQTFFRSDGRL